MASEHFYCVQCNRLEELTGGDVLFKTGYFRIVHPLGCCASCRAEAAETAIGYSAELLAAERVYRPTGAGRNDRAIAASLTGVSHLAWAAV